MLRREPRRRFKRGLPGAEIPTSSMADIAFLLIVFFLLTSVFASTKGLSFELPPPDDPGTDPEPAVLVHVSAQVTRVDCKPMTSEELAGYLEPKLARNPEKPVILYVEPDAPYHRMIGIYDLFAEIGATRNVQVPTQADIDHYRASFGENPLVGHCP